MNYLMGFLRSAPQKEQHSGKKQKNTSSISPEEICNDEQISRIFQKLLLKKDSSKQKEELDGYILLDVLKFIQKCKYGSGDTNEKIKALLNDQNFAAELSKLIETLPSTTQDIDSLLNLFFKMFYRIDQEHDLKICTLQQLLPLNDLKELIGQDNLFNNSLISLEILQQICQELNQQQNNANSSNLLVRFYLKIINVIWTNDQLKSNVYFQAILKITNLYHDSNLLEEVSGYEAIRPWIDKHQNLVNAINALVFLLESSKGFQDKYSKLIHRLLHGEKPQNLPEIKESLVSFYTSIKENDGMVKFLEFFFQDLSGILITFLMLVKYPDFMCQELSSASKESEYFQLLKKQPMEILLLLCAKDILLLLGNNADRQGDLSSIIRNILAHYRIKQDEMYNNLVKNFTATDHKNLMCIFGSILAITSLLGVEIDMTQSELDKILQWINVQQKLLWFGPDTRVTPVLFCSILHALLLKESYDYSLIGGQVYNELKPKMDSNPGFRSIVESIFSNADLLPGIILLLFALVKIMSMNNQKTSDQGQLQKFNGMIRELLRRFLNLSDQKESGGSSAAANQKPYFISEENTPDSEETRVILQTINEIFDRKIFATDETQRGGLSSAPRRIPFLETIAFIVISLVVMVGVAYQNSEKTSETVTENVLQKKIPKNNKKKSLFN